MNAHLNRRIVITLLGGATAPVLWPRTARVQQVDRMRRIGVLMGTAESDENQRALVATLVRSLAELGWRDGRNIRIEYRWAAGDSDRLRAQAAELAHLPLDVIFVQGTPGATALRQATSATPIVFVMVTDPVASGLAESLARPGGNLTGFTNYELTMGGKWLETLHEISPNIRRVAVVHNPGNLALQPQFRAIAAAGPTLGVHIKAAHVRNAADIERAIDECAAETDGGLLVLVDFITLAHRDLITKLAIHRRLPAIFNLRVFAISGGLISYGIDPTDLFRRAAAYIDRVLKGANPAELPVQQPTKFELIVNLKTAKAIGLTIPETFLVRADEVIE